MPSTPTRPCRMQRFLVFGFTNVSFISHRQRYETLIQPAGEEGMRRCCAPHRPCACPHFYRSSPSLFSRTAIDRQLAQSSSSDTSAGLLARSALDIVVSDVKQELLSPLSQPITSTN